MEGNNKISVAVCAGSGYTGRELIRLLNHHPNVSLKAVTSRSHSGTHLGDMVQGMRNKEDDDLLITSALDKTKNYQVIFFAAPTGVAMQQTPFWLQKGTKVIDLASDFRLQNENQWKEWYAMKHTCPPLMHEAVYGLCELNREAIKNARLIANPGCYPTATLLGLLPLLSLQEIVPHSTLIVDAKSGTSGAGRSPKTELLYTECAENFRAYATTAHRHWPEIHNTLILIHKTPLNLVFNPHLLPVKRGLFASIYCKTQNSLDVLQQKFVDFYSDEAFVRVLPSASFPQLTSVQYTNLCEISLHQPKNSQYTVILSVIDNLVKGAAGQAIQNMNICFGLEETCGLY